MGASSSVDAVKRVLHSLACGKSKRVLKKTPDNSSVKEADLFAFNHDFSSPAIKFQLPMPSLEESHDPKQVEEGRKAYMDAAIVRVMKARKTLTHSALEAEAMKQLQNFSPSSRDIKKRIEDLIERDYLARWEEGESKGYSYIA